MPRPCVATRSVLRFGATCTSRQGMRPGKPSIKLQCWPASLVTNMPKSVPAYQVVSGFTESIATLITLQLVEIPAPGRLSPATPEASVHVLPVSGDTMILFFDPARLTNMNVGFWAVALIDVTTLPEGRFERKVHVPFAPNCVDK